MPFVGPIPKVMHTDLPLVEIGDRKGLTSQQIADHPELMEMIRLFPDGWEQSFEYDAMLLVEPVTH